MLIRWSIAQTLTDAGHAVLEAENGAAAILALSGPRTLSTRCFSTFGCPTPTTSRCSRIRQLTPESSVILMTAFGTPEVIQGALDLGVDRVISKPFDMHDVSEMVVETWASRQIPTKHAEKS